MHALRRVFSIDYRSLRLFRVLVGLAAALDAIYRMPVITEFYTDDGVLPRAMIYAKDTPRWFSLYMLSGNYWWSASLLMVTLIVAVLLILEYRPQIISAVLFILIVSVDHRNSHILFGVDSLMRAALLWSIFLPSSRSEKGIVANWASAAALIQIAVIYFCAGWLKSSDMWLWHPDASYYAMHAEFYVSRLGLTLRNFPGPLRIGTVITVLIERFGWLLFFSPWQSARMRTLAFFLMAGLHILFSMALELGLFPLVDIAFLTLLLPTEFWDGLIKRAQTLAIYRPEPLAYLRQSAALQSVCAVFLVMMVWWNLNDLEPGVMPASISFGMKAVGLDQGWGMFAPEPMQRTGWFVTDGLRPNGEHVDPMSLSEHEASFARPNSVGASLPHPRWLEFLVEIALEERKGLRARYGDYLCAQWKRAKNEKLSRVDFYFMAQMTAPPGALTLAHRELVFSKPCM
jgi:hypothetical protein